VPSALITVRVSFTLASTFFAQHGILPAATAVWQHACKGAAFATFLFLQQAFLDEQAVFAVFFAQASFLQAFLSLQHFLSANTTPVLSISVKANRINFFIILVFYV